jgi:hypothetical protein
MPPKSVRAAKSVAPAAPFEDADVLAALRNVVSESTRLGLHTPAVVHLTNVLKIIRWKLQAGAQNPRPIFAPNEMRAWDGWIQTEIWPGVNQGYAEAGGQMRWNMLDAAKAQADLPELQRKLDEFRTRRRQIGETLHLNKANAARQYDTEIAALEAKIARLSQAESGFYDHINAVQASRRHALGFARGILGKSELKSWKDFAEELRAIFCLELPGQAMTAAYHFIAIVAPNITGERTTVSAVESFLKKKRYVKRGVSASRGKRS